MTAFIAAYRGECSKILRRKKYIVFLCVGVFICLVWAGIGGVLSGLAERFVGIAINLAPSPMGVLPLFLQVMIPLLIFMGVTDLFTVEGAENTMKAMIMRPVERAKLFSAKILSVMTYSALYLGVVFVVSAVLNQIFGRALGVNDLAVALASYALTILPLMVLASFAALVALLGRSGTLTMFLLIVVYLVMGVLPVLVPVTGQLLFTSYLGWHRLWIGALPGVTRLVHMLVIVFGYGVVFFTAGSLVFDKKEY